MRRVRKIIFILLIPAAVFSGLYLYLDVNYYPPILMYHHIDEEIAQRDTINNPKRCTSLLNSRTISISAEIFARQMEFIQRHNYKVVSLEELCGMIKLGKRLARNLVAITFDDGYKDNLVAARILKKHSFPATIFIAVNWIGEPGYLNSDDLDWIAHNSPVAFGSHTLNHRYLPEIQDEEELRQEISGSKQKARREYGLELSTLAYPVGGFTPAAITQVKESGYLCACTTNRRLRRQPDIYALRRIKVTDRDLGIRLWGKLSGFYTVLRPRVQ